MMTNDKDYIDSSREYIHLHDMVPVIQKLCDIGDVKEAIKEFETWERTMTQWWGLSEEERIRLMGRDVMLNFIRTSQHKFGYKIDEPK